MLPLLMIKNRTSSNCTNRCVNDPTTLTPKTVILCSDFKAMTMTIAEHNEPENDSRKVGLNSVPVAKAPITDFAVATIIASFIKDENINSNTMIFENPIFMNGNGRGSSISKKYNPLAIAVIIAKKNISLFTTFFLSSIWCQIYYCDF